jgi:hypothetical protein
MSLQSIIQNLSEKPDHIRKRYSLLISFGVTAVIFVFWLSSFNFVSDPQDRIMASAIEGVDTPSQSIVASVGALAIDIKDMIFGPKKVKYSTIEVVPGRK